MAVAMGIPMSGVGCDLPGPIPGLQIGPVVLLLPLAYWALRRWPISNLACRNAFTGFVLLHLFAARWSYSFVPYDQWVPGGVDATLFRGFERKHVRPVVVHFLVRRFCQCRRLVEVGLRYWSLSRRMALGLRTDVRTGSLAGFTRFSNGA